MSRTFLALLHYDGGDFVGWQRQPAGRSVQAEMERALERLCGRRIVTHASGRTDAGVHAIGMGVSFSAPSRWEDETLRRALNSTLPRDCWVERVTIVKPGFHARKSATGRQYRYDVGTDALSMSPFRRPYEWALGRALEFSLLQEAADLIRGPHDFSAFAAKPAERLHCRCDVRQAEWRRRSGSQGVSFHVAADRFLHHMVRFLVGTMVDIGLGRRPVEDMTRLLMTLHNQDTSPPAPPQGLYFVAAEYPADIFLTNEIPVPASV